MTANGIKVLEAMASMRPNWWWRSDEIAKAAGLSSRSVGAVLAALYYREEAVGRDYVHAERRFIYRINDKGLEIARAST